MLGYWSFDIAPPAPRRDRTFVLFCSAAEPDEEAVAQRVEEYCDAHFSPNCTFRHLFCHLDTNDLG